MHALTSSLFRERGCSSACPPCIHAPRFFHGHSFSPSPDADGILPLWRGFPATPCLRPVVSTSFRFKDEEGDLWSEEWSWSGDHATTEVSGCQNLC